jgi:hypothetical protein
MYASCRMGRIRHPFITPLWAMALLGLALTVAPATAVSPAQAANTKQADVPAHAKAASVSDWYLTARLYTTQVHDGCSASGSASWCRAANRVYISGRAQSTAAFYGCRVRRVVRYYDDQNALLAESPANIPTACGTWDWTCPSTTYLNTSVAPAVPASLAALVDHITISAERRYGPA